MAKYRVWAEMITDCYLDVEADSPEEAYDIAYDADGGEFIDTDSGDWRMSPVVEELDDNDNIIDTFDMK